MAERSYVKLANRGLISVGGSDGRAFLQGLISNDADKVSPSRAVHAALLTPQGKYLHDFFVAELEGALVLDCEGARADDLRRRLGIYKLRADVEMSDIRERFAVVALLGEGAAEAVGLAPEAGAAGNFGGGVAFVDARLAAAGVRAVLPREDADRILEEAGFAAAPPEDYDRLRLRLGLPDGSRDMVLEKATLLENGFEELNGVDFGKGCFLGQELTARTKYRGLVKKRLLPVDIDGPPPAAGTPVLLEGREAGEMRSSSGGLGLALMRLETLRRAAETGAALTAGGATLTPRIPAWAVIGAGAGAGARKPG